MTSSSLKETNILQFSLRYWLITQLKNTVMAARRPLLQINPFIQICFICSVFLSIILAGKISNRDLTWNYYRFLNGKLKLNEIEYTEWLHSMFIVVWVTSGFAFSMNPYQRSTPYTGSNLPISAALSPITCTKEPTSSAAQQKEKQVNKCKYT